MRATHARQKSPIAVALLFGVLTFAGTARAGGSASAVTFHTLRPGAHPIVGAPVRVDIVLVGYAPDAIDLDRIVSRLPASGRPIARVPAESFGANVPLGLEYRYQYRTRFAPKSFEDGFFAFLASAGIPGLRSQYQTLYNQQQHSVLRVPKDVLYIDAQQTESWLERSARSQLGIPAGDYVLFFVNWYGRSDFQFHLYAKPGSPDPDTGVDGGFAATHFINAWGGSSGRSWFLDLSAGPEFWQGSYDVDNADVDGDGVADYRLPPIWEYGNTTGYRPFTDLSGDLARVARYVAIDQLFTTSPIYDPGASVPGPQAGKRIAVELFEGEPTIDGVREIDPQVIQARHQELEPYYAVDVTLGDQPFQGDVLRAFQIQTGELAEDDCWNSFGAPTTELFCFFEGNRQIYFPPHGDTFVIPVAGFTGSDQDWVDFGLLGVTDPNYTTGAPGYIYVLEAPILLSAGIGYSRNVIHEAGHYVGLSHPHDGYDPPSRTDRGPFRGDYFLWFGDMSSSAMSYLPVTNDFGAFDHDNIDRWEAGRLLSRADAELPAILKASKSPNVVALLLAADRQFGVSVKALGQGDWRNAANQAVTAYRSIQQAAALAHVPATTAPAALEALGPRAPRPDMERPHVLP